ncbi:ABC transporter permease [Clostridium pasteurianum]|uniref:ABC-type nitrate/sulfonate/bicarbonate transport system, permease component n=1 Tax=Clostridium pasteurianum BC1 TaxID=86416 RepID=R4K8I7_CLOPA|nr:ABC transporter permease [Clostridium pasteurianum]AGK98878.1 ABC-type nitrate/sulfonate/bicarbonate transport system, permease component [Clostridium pasteurianum BC1]
MKYFGKLLKLGIISWIFIIAVWEIASLFSRPDFLPGPLAVITGANELVKDGTLFKFIFISFRRVLTGWVLGSLIGVPIGLLIGKIKAVKSFVEPILNFFRFVPAIGFITLFILWFGIGEAGKIVLIMYATTFIVMLNTSVGVANIQEEKIRAARCLGASESQILFNVIIPASVPHVFTGVRLAMGNSFAAIVGAEMLAANEGIGYLIWTARLYFKTEWVFIGLISLGLMGFFTDKVLGVVAGVVFKNYGITRKGGLKRAA